MLLLSAALMPLVFFLIGTVAQKTMRDKVERLLTIDFTDLTVFAAPDTMEAENVCSVAGKEV